MNPLIITGSAPCVMADIEAAPGYMDCDFMAVGLDAVDKYAWPIKYAATFHEMEIQQIHDRRKSIGGNTDYKLICHLPREGADILIKDWWPPSGSSALLGVQAALRIGYERIILCGCPLTGKNVAGADYEKFRVGWEARKTELGDCVRSMSGWTRELLGPPSGDWLL